MVQLVLRLVAPSGHRNEIVEALRSVVRPAQADRGCRWAQVYRAEDNPSLIAYVEEWAEEDELKRQMDSERFCRLLAVLELAAEPPTIEFRFVTETRGLEFVSAARQPADAIDTGSVTV